MPSAVRIGDIGSGHGCFAPHTVITGNPKVLIEGIPASCIGDVLTVHCCGPVCHPGLLASGSTKVLIGGRPLSKIGSIVNCGSIMVSGSTKVLVDQAVPVVIMPTTIKTSSGETIQLPPEYSSENVAEIVQVAGKYAVFDDPDSIDSTPDSIPNDIPEHTMKNTPDKSATNILPPSDTPILAGCQNISGIDYNLRLSQHFTLGMLSSNALFKHTIKAQAGFTEEQIICNLKGLCENVLEKIWEKYPNFRINSGFRTFTVGKSQHEKGQACDIQWPGISNAEYKIRALWIRDNIIFDQLLFEHGNMIWIHVSFNRNNSKQRKDVKTMYKGKFEPGIVLYYN